MTRPVTITTQKKKKEISLATLTESFASLVALIPVAWMLSLSVPSFSSARPGIWGCLGLLAALYWAVKFAIIDGLRWVNRHKR